MLYAAKATESATMDLAQPVLRETVEVYIDGKKEIRYKDEIEKEIYKALQKPIYKGLMLEG